MKREEVSWASAFIPHCFPNTDSMWQAASSSRAVFPTVMGRTFKLWAEIDSFLPQLLLFCIFFTTKRKGTSSMFYSEFNREKGLHAWGSGSCGVWVGCGWGVGVLPPSYVVLWLKFSFVQTQGPEGGPYITQTLSGHCHSPPCSLVDPPLLRHTTVRPPLPPTPHQRAEDLPPRLLHPSRTLEPSPGLYTFETILGPLSKGRFALHPLNWLLSFYDVHACSRPHNP